MKPEFFSSYNKWIIGVILLFLVTCKEREWEFYATIKTNEITVFSNVAAVTGGTVIHDGHSVITETGICYSKLPNPDLNDNRINISGFISEFSGKIESLDPGTTYYVRAYVINNKGVSYGEEVSFTTDEPLTDVEGNVYKTVIIGDQVWMAENLKTTKYRDGTAISYLTDKTTWAGLTTGAYCYFLNSTSNGSVYGGLYNFYTVINNHNLCPNGWHVPSDEEWSILREYLGGENVAGGKLKETGTAHWESPNTGADNSSGYTALGGSWRGEDGLFYYYVGRMAYWWTSTEVDINNAWEYHIFYNSASLFNHYGTYHRKKAGHSVRCIKD